MKKLFLLALCGVLGALFAASGSIEQISHTRGVAVIFEDKIRLGFLIISAIVMNIVYYASAPPGVSKWFYLDLKKTFQLLFLFIVAQLIFNLLVSAIYWL